MMRFFLLFSMVLCAGCSSLSKKDFQPSENPVLTQPEVLTLDSVESRNNRITQFFIDNIHFTEANKIHYLLNSIRQSDCIFIRNGSQYRGDQAAGWLRWKMHHRQYRDNPIVTARDFVDRVSLQSNTTGQPYEILLPNGKRAKTRDVLANELDALENAVRERAIVSALEDKNRSITKNQKAIPPRALIPVTA